MERICCCYLQESELAQAMETIEDLQTQLAEHEGGAELVHLHPVRQIAWHARGDYFASVAPTGTDMLSEWRSLCESLLQEASSDVAPQATQCCLMKPSSAAGLRMPRNVSGTLKGH